MIRAGRGIDDSYFPGSMGGPLVLAPCQKRPGGSYTQDNASRRQDVVLDARDVDVAVRAAAALHRTSAGYVPMVDSYTEWSSTGASRGPLIRKIIS